MTMLRDLPEELIFHICSTLMLESLLSRSNPRPVRLAALQARLALSRFSQTCSRHRSIAQPLLFRCYGDMIFRPRTRLRFLEALLDQPELAREVRYINPSQVHAGKITATANTNLELFERAARALGVKDVETLLLRLRPHVPDHQEDEGMEENILEDILVPIFLAFLPNLKALRVPLSSSSLHTPILLQIPTLLDLIPGCRKVESLNVDPIDHVLAKFPLAKKSLTLLTLPSLRKVTLNSFWSEADFRLEPQSLGITDLSLHNGHMSSTSLQVLLQACRSLEKFHYKWTNHGLFSFGSRTASTQDIVAALDCHKGSLKSLSLDMKQQIFYLRYYLETPPISADSAPIETLSHFTALEHLVVDQLSIFAGKVEPDNGFETEAPPWTLVKLLPASIKSLRVLVTTSIYEPFQQLAIQMEKVFPMLLLVSAQSGGSRGFSSLEGLKPLFKQAGATFCNEGSPGWGEDEKKSWDSDPLFELLTVGDLLE